MAITHEKFYYLYELLSWEKVLLEEAYEEGEFTVDLDKLIADEKHVIEKLRNLAAYHVLYSKINYLFRSGGYSRNDKDRKVVEEISNHPLIKEKNTALSSRAATICYFIQGFCAMANRDWKVSKVKFIRVKEIFDKSISGEQEMLLHHQTHQFPKTMHIVHISIYKMIEWVHP